MVGAIHGRTRGQPGDWTAVGDAAVILRAATLDEVRPLFERHHQYAGVSAAATYTFAVEENGEIVAAFTWQPPPFGAARSVCPEMPQAVLSLSRMAAVPKKEREMKKISKPLRVQRDLLIDRTRWPVLITYSDEGVINERGSPTTGNSYLYAGFEKTTKRRVPQFSDPAGRRSSTYRNGLSSRTGLTLLGHADIQRWEHWACERGQAAVWMAEHGWVRVPVPGKVWKSGSPAHRFSYRPVSP